MISTRMADADDAAEAIELLRRSFMELCVDGHQNDEATVQAWLQNKTTERFARWLADPDTRVIIAECDGAIRGVGSIHRSGEIRLCYVWPGFQATGVGRALLTALEEHAHLWRLSSVHLTSGIGARAFYERCGYQPSEIARPGFGISILFPYAKVLSQT
jgi:GNAT superfamily N-acetyltransferase